VSLIFLCLAAAAVDGDTLRCANVAEANGRVRLARIDAPEMATPEGPPAKAALAAMLTGAVRCEQVDASPDWRGFQAHDRYGRIVARCSVEGRDLGAAMLRAGQAVKWPRR
jgi:endonuclease YncB( thermonuclease family)